MTTKVNPYFQQVSPTKEQISESIAVLDKKISEELNSIAAKQQKRATQLASITAPFRHFKEVDTQTAKTTISALKDLEKESFEEQRLKVNDSLTGLKEQQTFMLSIDTTLKIGGPPYDVDWTTGGFCSADKTTGEFRVNPVNGYAAAAVGMYLSPTQDTFAELTAYMPISYSWANWNYGGGSAWSSGGVGILIYDLSGSIIPFDNRAVLWNAGGVPWFEQHEETTYLSNTTAAKTSFILKAGGTFLVWAWCWGNTGASNDAVALASITCKMPFFVVKPVWF
jgi:hypothetical protein